MYYITNSIGVEVPGVVASDLDKAIELAKWNGGTVVNLHGVTVWAPAQGTPCYCDSAYHPLGH